MTTQVMLGLRNSSNDDSQAHRFEVDSVLLIRFFHGLHAWRTNLLSPCLLCRLCWQPKR